MAKFTAFAAVDMSNGLTLLTDEGESFFLSSSEQKVALIDNSGNKQEYIGEIFLKNTFVPDPLVSGAKIKQIDISKSTLQGFNQYNSGGNLSFSLSELNFKGKDVLTFTGKGDIGRIRLLNSLLNGKDTITGSSFNDKLYGGGSADSITGGNGADTFIYKLISESGVGKNKRDVITDFNGLQGDKIDLSAIDAFTKLPGDQAFTYIGSSAFTGTQGEVRFSGGVLQLNTGTDKVADMEIALTGVTTFGQDYLIR